MEIPLGIQTDEGGSFTLNAKEMLNMELFDVYLRDSWRNIEHKLDIENPYRFTLDSENNTDRFRVVFRNSGSTNNDAIFNNGNAFLRAYSDKTGNIIVLYNGSDDCNVNVYDILGNKITDQNVVSKTSTTLQGKFTNGIYLLQAGKYTTKVVVR